jgi:hypothetical protein
MLGKHCAERLDDRLLTRVDARISAELVGRFENLGRDGDGNVAAIRRMSEHVLAAVEELSARHAIAWKSVLEESNQHWAGVSAAAGKVVHDSLAASLNDSFASALNEGLDRHARTLNDGVLRHADRLTANSTQHAERVDQSARDVAERLGDGLERLAELLVEALQQHGEVLVSSEKELAQENRRHLADVEAALGEAMVVAADRQERLIRQSENLLKEMQVALVEAAGATVRQQEQLVKQGDVLLSVVDATGQVKKLETTLNQNLAALRQGFQFEELALSMSAAIQLLCARLGRFSADGPAFDDADNERNSQAA